MKLNTLINTLAISVLLLSCSGKVEVECVAALESVPFGSIERLTMDSDYITQRPIDIWLPENYPNEAPYNVIYAEDGGALFGIEKKEDGTWSSKPQEWHVDETVSKLISDQVIEPTIVVAIHNAKKMRNKEYFPQRMLEVVPTETIQEMFGDGFYSTGNNYLKFLVDELKPYVDSHYAVRTDKKSTRLMGSSAGSNISLYAQCEYPDVFGAAACIAAFGPFVNTEGFTNGYGLYLNEHLPAVEKGNRFYFDHANDDLTPYIKAQSKIDKVMEAKGYGPDQWQTHFYKGEHHNGKSWSRRLDIILRFLEGEKTVYKTVPKTKYRLYVMAGQSNMEGFGFSKDLTEEMRHPNYDVMCFNGTIAGDNDIEHACKGVWDYLRPGFGTGYTSNDLFNTYSDRFGPELAFGWQIAKEHPNEKIAIIKYARGGSGIPAGSSGFGTWDPVFNEGLGLNQLDFYYNTLKKALADKDINNDGIEDELIPCGIIWMQGETDGMHLNTAKDYYNNLTRTMQLFRASLRDNDLPVVIGKISDSVKNGPGKHIQYDYLIHKAQQKFCETDAHAVWVENPDNYRFIEDGWHFQSDCFIDLGTAFAKAMKSLEK